MKRDQKSNMDAVQSLAPLVRTASANGTGVDVSGCDAATVVFEAGAIVSSGNQTPSIEESDDDSTYAAVDSDDLVGSLAVLTAASVQRVGYIGTKKYIRAVITHNSGTSVATSAVVIRSLPHVAPLA